MRALRFALNGLAREWRSGELAVLIAALLVAVTAMTAVGLITDRVRQAVAVQAAEILAADLVVSSSDLIDEALDAQAQIQGMETARTLVDKALAESRAIGAAMAQPDTSVDDRIRASRAQLIGAHTVDVVAVYDPNGKRLDVMRSPRTVVNSLVRLRSRYRRRTASEGSM